MNVKGLVVYLHICLVAFMLLGVTGCKDIALDIEDNNAYSWQKYMNEQEFNLLEEGISYMDAVTIAGGIGEEIENNVYVWQEETILTRAYEVHFENNKLVSKEIIEKRGYSTR